MTRPKGIVDFTPDPKLYPFKSHWFESSVGPIHYIDEGEGPVVLLMHGNPNWSFIYRDIIKMLGPNIRCVAPDYPGFGLSVHPDPKNYGYFPSDHAKVMLEFVEHLTINDAVIMGGDWGGPISMDVSSRDPERFKGIVMANTWYWPSDRFVMKTFSRLMGSWLLRTLIKRKNFFVKVIMKHDLQVKLPPHVYSHYTDVLPTPESRIGTAIFPTAIRKARPWFSELEKRVAQTLRDKPVALLFGKKDIALSDDGTIARWKEDFPNASVEEFPDGGHFFQEDNPEACVKAIREILASTSGEK